MGLERTLQVISKMTLLTGLVSLLSMGGCKNEGSLIPDDDTTEDYEEVCIEWEKTYGGSERDYASSVQQTSDGGYVMAGQTESFGAGNQDWWLVKTDFLGNEEWNKTYGGSEDDKISSVQQTSDGGYVMAGQTESFGDGSRGDMWLVKTDFLGNEEWNKTYGGSEVDWALSVQQTSDGGYVMIGQTRSFGDGNSGDMWLVKTDSLGNEEWNERYGGSADDWAFSGQQTSDGGYVMTGSTNSFGAGAFDMWLVKTDYLGNEEWNETYGGSEVDWAFSGQQTSDGGYVMVGYTWSFGAGERDWWLVKTDSLGNEEWNKTYGGSERDLAVSVQQTSDGGYVMAGYTNSFGVGEGYIWLVKTDSLGDEEWNERYGGSEDNGGVFSVQQTSDGGYVMIGQTELLGAGHLDMWLVKMCEP